MVSLLIKIFHTTDIRKVEVITDIPIMFPVFDTDDIQQVCGFLLLLPEAKS